jgi:uncharacterized protein YyaL (SSP411 family)
VDAYAEDYAFLIWGLLELFQAGGDPTWLEWAMQLQRRQDDLFWNENGGGWYSTREADSSLLLRLRDDDDGAEPSANSVAVANLMCLAHLTGDSAWQNRAELTLGAFASQMEHAGRSVPMMLVSLAAYHVGLQQVVLVGSRTDPDLRELARVIRRRFLPFAITVIVEPGAHQEQLSRLVPPVRTMTLCDGRPTVYVCRDYAWREPVTDPSALDAQLSG